MQIDLLCPVESQGVAVKTKAKTGEVYALFKLFNVSRKVVTEVSFAVCAFDAYGGKLGEFNVVFSDLEAQPKSFFAEKKAVSLMEYQEAKHITVEINEVKFSEGEPYIKPETLTEITITEPDYEERMRLSSVAGSDAVCYAKDCSTHWVCVCGRPNLTNEKECVRCGREKAEVLAKFSTRNGVTKAISQKEAKQKKEQENLEAQAAQQAKDKKKKWIKIGIISAISLVCLVILWFLAQFAIDWVYILKGNQAAKNGDYLKAYEYYQKADSEKANEVSEQVLGNTSANIYQGGLIATDKENIYYIDEAYKIYKESKATGEKSRLGNAMGYSLNVMDGWVYFLDYTQQRISRIKTDATEMQHVYESIDQQLDYLTVVGNKLYFIATGMREDLTPEMQMEIAMGGSTANAYYRRLYSMEIGQTEANAVADTYMIQFQIYKGRVYYLDRDETAVYSMKIDGSDVKKLVSGPIYNFTVSDDIIYYLDGTPDATTQIPKFSLEMANLDGTYKGNVVSDKMVASYAISNGDIYYVAYNDAEATSNQLFKKTANGEELIDENCIRFNVREDYVFYYTSDRKVMKTKFDKSGFESVSAADHAGAGETAE